MNNAYTCYYILYLTVRELKNIIYFNVSLEEIMDQVLVVEDSRLFGTLIQRKIDRELNINVVWAQTYTEAVNLIEKDSSTFFVGLLDLNLPDSQDGKIVDYVLSKDIPVIVFTGEFSDDIRELIWTKKVVDYVFKESNHNLDYVVSLIKRIYLNRLINVLVVDDSNTFRTRVSDLLKVHLYNVFEAANGAEAVQVLKENPNIKLVVTDYNMPKMDGFQLIDEIRQNYTKEDLAIIGMSGNNTLSARFIKHGANDFINKEFFSEEFYCRITQNIEMLEYIKMIRDASNTDFLTDLYNRRYFFELGSKLYSNSKRSGIPITIAMLDIDFFKKVNDNYGHDGGDIVLKRLGQLLKSRFRESDIVARFGGEEFCIMTYGMDSKHSLDIYDELRQRIERTPINIYNNTIKVTVSIGVCAKKMDTLDEMISQADEMLYQAKAEGRNRVKHIV